MRFLACVSPLGGLDDSGPGSRKILRQREQQNSLPITRRGWLRLIFRTTGSHYRRDFTQIATTSGSVAESPGPHVSRETCGPTRTSLQ